MTTDELVCEYLAKSGRGIPTKVMAQGTKRFGYMTTVYKNPNKGEADSKKFNPMSANNTFIDLINHKPFTLSQIKTYWESMPKSRKANYTDIQDFVQKSYFISDGQTTTARAFRLSLGKYTTQRFNSVHRPIIDRKLSEADTPPLNIKPVVFLYGGGSASGKTSVVHTIVQPIIDKLPYKFAELDCDEIKKEIPEVSVFEKENPKTAPIRVHRESSDIVNEVMDAMINRKKCFTYDGCMGDFKKYNTIITKLKTAGYEIHVVGVSIPTDMAVERAKQRDRSVPESVIRKSHKDFSQVFPKIMTLPVDSYVLYDNSQKAGEPHKLIVNSDGEKDIELYNQFLKKGE